MKDRLAALMDEKVNLNKRLNWLGLRSTGSDRIEARIKAIDAEIETLCKQAV